MFIVNRPFYNRTYTSDCKTAIPNCEHQPLLADIFASSISNKFFPSVFNIVSVLIHGFLFLLLPMEHLRTLYSHLLSGILLCASHFVSERYVTVEMTRDPGRSSSWPSTSMTPSEHLRFGDTSASRSGSSLLDYPLATVGCHSRHLTTLLCHLAISLVVFSFLERPSRSLQILLCVHMLPVLARVANFPLETLPILQTFGDTLLCLSVLYYMGYKLPSLLDRIKETYTNAVTVSQHGVNTMRLLSAMWDRLFVPAHFVVFWTLSFCGKAAEALAVDSGYSRRPLIFLLECASAVCCSPINLLATSVVVWSLSGLIIRGLRLFLGAGPDVNPMHSGWTQGAAMLLLGLQTGIMQAELPGRALVLLIILFIVVSTLLQNIFEITEPIVLSLSASRSLTRWRHARVLLVCGLLFVVPLLLTFKLAAILPIDTWIVMILSTCVLTSVQVLGMIAVHALFVYDGMHEDSVGLDDVVYVTRACTKLLELLVSLFVVVASVYESSTVKWNLSNSMILAVHTYCNVYRRIRAGWRSFLLGREASMKTDSLAAPSLAQLAAYNDVCPICYLWLGGGPDDRDEPIGSCTTSATGKSSAAAAACCITPCRHYFHRNCIKKWLYSQDACPMCHQKIIMQTTSLATHTNEEAAGIRVNEADAAEG